MSDTRERLGYTVHRVGPPYGARPPKRSGPEEGGTLDRIITATDPDGKEWAIGEIWAVAVDGKGGTLRINSVDMARQIAQALTGQGGT